MFQTHRLHNKWLTYKSALHWHMLKTCNAAKFDMICGLKDYMCLEEYWHTCYRFLCKMNSETLN